MICLKKHEVTVALGIEWIGNFGLTFSGNWCNSFQKLCVEHEQRWFSKQTNFFSRKRIGTCWFCLKLLGICFSSAWRLDAWCWLYFHVGRLRDIIYLLLQNRFHAWKSYRGYICEPLIRCFMTLRKLFENVFILAVANAGLLQRV